MIWHEKQVVSGKGVVIGFVVSALFLVFVWSARAQDLEEAELESVEQVQAENSMVVVAVEQKVMVEETSYSVHCITAFLRDEDLVRQGYAPEDWVQPAFEIYEAELGSRPSMLPYENFMGAVSAEVVPTELGVAYAMWVAEQAATP